MLKRDLNGGNTEVANPYHNLNDPHCILPLYYSLCMLKTTSALNICLQKKSVISDLLSSNQERDLTSEHLHAWVAASLRFYWGGDGLQEGLGL